MGFRNPFRSSNYVGDFASSTAAESAITGTGSGNLGLSLDVGMFYYDTTDGVFKAYNGSSWDQVGGGVSQWDETVTLHVAKHGDDSNNGQSINKAKLTIGSAITAATALSPTVSNPVTIIVHTGVYDENVGLANAYVNITGVERASCVITKATGISFDLNGVDNINISDLTIIATGTAYVMRTDTASDVTFDNCRFYDNSTSGGHEPELGSSAGHIFSGRFNNCIFDTAAAAQYALSDLYASNEVEFWDCVFNNGYYSTGSIQMHNCVIPSGLSACLYAAGAGTTKELYDCKCVNSAASGNGYAINAAANIKLRVFGGEMRGNDNASFDIVGPSTMDDAFVQGVRLRHGLEAEIAVQGRVRRAGGDDGDMDFYANFAEALDSVESGDDVIIELQEDVSYSGFGDTTPASSKVVITGLGMYQMTHASSSFTLGPGQGSELELRDMEFSQGRARLANTGATLRLGPGFKATGGMADITSAADGTSLFIMDGASINSGGGLYGMANQPAFDINDADCEVRIFRSYLKGEDTSGGYAIDLGADNPNIKIAHSTLMHGSLSTNKPISQPQSGNIDFASHHNTWNEDPEYGTGNTLTNSIATPYDVIDTDGDYDWTS
jgi:hypothetical protein